MERVGPSCSRQQCAAPPSAPRIKLKNGLTAPRNTDLGERPHPIFPHAPASPKGTRKLKTSSRRRHGDMTDTSLTAKPPPAGDSSLPVDVFTCHYEGKSGSWGRVLRTLA